jgi:hypothetical protein
MVGSVKDLVFHPDTFFAQVSKEKAGFIWPVVIVALGSIVTFVGAVVLSPAATDPLTQYSITFLSLFLGALATWFILSTGLYLLSRAFSGTGSYLITLQNTGYGMFPLVFSSAITFLSAALVAGQGGSSSSWAPAVIVALYYIPQLVFTVWAGYLWFCGVRNAHKLQAPLAVATVVIVICVSLALFLILMKIMLH